MAFQWLNFSAFYSLEYECQWFKDPVLRKKNFIRINLDGWRKWCRISDNIPFSDLCMRNCPSTHKTKNIFTFFIYLQRNLARVNAISFCGTSKPELPVISVLASWLCTTVSKKSIIQGKYLALSLCCYQRASSTVRVIFFEDRGQAPAQFSLSARCIKRILPSTSPRCDFSRDPLSCQKTSALCKRQWLLQLYF